MCAQEFEISLGNLAACVALNRRAVIIHDRCRSTTDPWRSVSVDQGVIATMNDKGRDSQQIAGFRLMVANGQHKVSRCQRSTEFNDA